MNTTGICNMDMKKEKKLIKVIDSLGRETQKKENQALFYIYENGIIEKKYELNKNNK